MVIKWPRPARRYTRLRDQTGFVSQVTEFAAVDIHWPLQHDPRHEIRNANRNASNGHVQTAFSAVGACAPYREKRPVAFTY